METILAVLRDNIKDDSVDLIYLIRRSIRARRSMCYSNPQRVITGTNEAFKDTWHWSSAATLALMKSSTRTSSCFNHAIGMNSVLGENDMMAYLAMMAVAV